MGVRCGRVIQAVKGRIGPQQSRNLLGVRY